MKYLNSFFNTLLTGRINDDKKNVVEENKTKGLFINVIAPEVHKLDFSLIGQKFKYYKDGKVYMVINFAKDSDSLKDLVSYQSIGGTDVTIWITEYDTFFGELEINGKKVRVFEPFKEN